METQDHRKNVPSGHEGHGVHVCSKCRWPFPNPRPSAKHRRAHKKICGTIEGYKLTDSEEKTTLLYASDDEHLSDDDHKIAILEGAGMLERTISGRITGGIGSRSSVSIRSEDDVFSDAVTDFGDSSTTENAQLTVENTVADAGNLCSENSLVDCMLPENLHHLKSEIVLESCMMSQDYASSSTMDPDESSVLDTGGEALAVGEIVTHSSTTSTRLHSDAKEIEGGISDGNLSEPEAIHREAVTETSGAVSSAEEVNGETSDSISADAMVKMTGKQSDGLETQDYCFAEVDSIGKTTSLIKSTVVTSDGYENIECNVKGEDCNAKSEGDEGFFALKLPEDLPLEGHPETVLNDFKDHERERLGIYAIPDSSQAIGSVECSKDCITLENQSIINSTESGGCTNFITKDDPSTCVHSMEDKQKPKVAENKPMAEAVPLESPAQESETKVGEDILPSRNVEVHSVSNKSEGEQGQIVSHPAEPEPGLLSDNSSEKFVPKGAEMVSCDNQETLSVTGDTETYDNKDIRTCDAVYIDSSKVAVHKLSETSFISSDPASYAAPQVNQIIGFLGDSNACDSGKTGVEDIGSNGWEVQCGEEEGIGVLAARKSSESEFITLESHDGMDNAMEHETKNEHSPMGSGSDSVDVGNVLENCSQMRNLESAEDNVEETHSSEDKMVRGESIYPFNMDFFLKDDANVAAVDMTPLSNNDTNVDFTLEMPGIIDLELHGDKVGSVQISAVEDNRTKEICVDVSSVHDEFLPVEGDNILVKPHLVVSANDVLRDSSSQTGSLESNWKSVSGATGAEAVASNNFLASLKIEGNLKAKTAAEFQQSDEFDVFEAPSFMTLVEPKVGDDQEEDASQNQTSQNPKNEGSVPLKAGWFPSLTPVANDSLGRKRNEEIIAKVSNWNTGKQQHAPLKRLLREANNDIIPKPTNPKEKLPHVYRKDESSITNNGSTPKMEEGNWSSKEPTARVAKGEEEHEWWNSPARFPANIKREKGKVKNRSMLGSASEQSFTLGMAIDWNRPKGIWGLPFLDVFQICGRSYVVAFETLPQRLAISCQ
ncbi:hypothetical protein Nepgr_009896 [Nepenthes gracilis]|uniref:C2H2-type domain-containing protein n=1 Tax=Nepenthes gracilis TaxID=150966 RepID=A0AAD3XKV5_NEPGR|nr:hypothetical protein Nepgr_009896 [Nepenthes gracilis]